jgi:hypothetical protein
MILALSYLLQFNIITIIIHFDPLNHHKCRLVAVIKNISRCTIQRVQRGYD